MAPTTLSRKRTFAAHRQIHKIRRSRVRGIYRVWSIVVKVDVKFHADARAKTQQFILMDITGCKIEAIAWEQNTERFKNLLNQGCIYTIHRVRFQPNLEDVPEFRNIANTFKCVLSKDTVVEPYNLPIQFPSYPKHLMPFHEVYRRPTKTFVDIAGVVVHWAQLGHIGNSHYREVTLMDNRYNLLVVGIWADHLNRNALNWSLANAENVIVLGTMLKNNRLHGCLESSDHSTFKFNPIYPTMLALQNLRQRVITGDLDLSFVQGYIDNRLAYLATVL